MNLFRPLLLTTLKCGLLLSALLWLAILRLFSPIQWDGIADLAFLLLVFLGGCATGACCLLEAFREGDSRRALYQALCEECNNRVRRN